LQRVEISIGRLCRAGMLNSQERSGAGDGPHLLGGRISTVNGRLRIWIN
jgi:hypothetical protein